ncbi:p24 complex component [Tulasnella sp. JGI-2019a]|nr:p24 complex component [Tulasnella sp. JGI-2019a]KAG9010883.1 p24 complex component [Tulasnella sp. JGI-2019a]KAG9037728.1 p24 complex component [Tulasnella sp. JGI-2019a]
MIIRRNSITLEMLLLFFLFFGATLAHRVALPASKRECFFEDLHVNDKMTVTYQVGGGGNLDINFFLEDPTKKHVVDHKLQSTGTYSMTADMDGRWTYCFSNEMSTMSDKEVSFNVHGVIYVADDGVVAPIEREVRSLAIGLQSVKDEQEYIVVRERTHRNTAESTNERVKWWSVAQTILLFAVCGWQVYYLKSFFEVKRVI